jgi:hypothetical protein
MAALQERSRLALHALIPQDAHIAQTGAMG